MTPFHVDTLSKDAISDTPQLNPEGWALVLDEHFNSIDPATWQTWGTPPAPVGVHVDTIFDPSCVETIDGGGLRLIAKDLADGKYPGGIIESVPSFTYGYFETRCKVPRGAGFWPAFWLWDRHDATLPEIDIFENLGLDTFYMSTHYGGKLLSVPCNTGDLSLGYHNFSARWDETNVIFYVDDTVRAAINHGGVLNAPQYILLDLFIGGWSGTPPPETVFPAYFDVDYIKVWQKT